MDIGSEYFVVYLSCVYIYIYISTGYPELPVLLYLLQCLVYHMLSKTRCSGNFHSNRWGIGARSTGGVKDSVQQLYVSHARCNWCVPIILLSIWYNVCVCHSPVYHYLIAIAVYLVQRIIAACVVVTWSQSLYLSRMNNQRGRWVVEYSLKERFDMKYLHQVSYLRLQDVIGVCPSYCCLSGTTCVLVYPVQRVCLS